jgi:hypothetical protein
MPGAVPSVPATLVPVGRGAGAADQKVAVPSSGWRGATQKT